MTERVRDTRVEEKEDLRDLNDRLEHYGVLPIDLIVIHEHIRGLPYTLALSALTILLYNLSSFIVQWPTLVACVLLWK